MNVHLDAIEHHDHIVFLHAVEDGPANQSYGLQVAQLAGVPQPVLRTAKKYLLKLEQEGISRSSQEDLFTPQPKVDPAVTEHPLLQLLKTADPDQMSPKQALELIYRLKQGFKKTQ